MTCRDLFVVPRCLWQQQEIGTIELVRIEIKSFGVSGPNGRNGWNVCSGFRDICEKNHCVLLTAPPSAKRRAQKYTTATSRSLQRALRWQKWRSAGTSTTTVGKSSSQRIQGSCSWVRWGEGTAVLSAERCVLQASALVRAPLRTFSVSFCLDSQTLSRFHSLCFFQFHDALSYFFFCNFNFIFGFNAFVLFLAN